jgi:hypothetical protein
MREEAREEISHEENGEEGDLIYAQEIVQVEEKSQEAARPLLPGLRTPSC